VPSVIELVGPKGYIHGWIFVGAPGLGAHVVHPQLGHGTVTGHNGSHATVSFAKGGTHSFEARPGKGTGHLAQRAGATQSAADRLKQAQASGLTGKDSTAALGLQAEVHVHSFKDGSQWISKKLPSTDDAEREVLAHKISDVIGAGSRSRSTTTRRGRRPRWARAARSRKTCCHPTSRRPS
jgi:hypothetical protein